MSSKFLLFSNLIIILLHSLRRYYVTVFTIVAAAYDKLKEQAIAIFIILFALIQFFFQFGANTTTFVIPVEVFPTRFRATAHGLLAACGY